VDARRPETAADDESDPADEVEKP